MPMTEKQYRLRERNAVRQWRESQPDTEAGCQFLHPPEPDWYVYRKGRQISIPLTRADAEGLAESLTDVLGYDRLTVEREHSDLCMCVYCMGHPVLPTLANR